jgi:hypothetical protein
MATIQLRLDPWPAEYESSFQIDEFDQDSAGKVETEVEGIGWSAVEPKFITNNSTC